MTHIWKQIASAVRRHQYMTITLPLSTGTATVSTIGGGPPWDVPVLIQIVVDKPGIRWRLMKIRIEDVLAEGVTPEIWPGGCKCVWAVDGCMDEPCSNRDSYEIIRHIVPFVKLWDSTIKPADRSTYGWDANPWVWVIAFERISKEQALEGGAANA